MSPTLKKLLRLNFKIIPIVFIVGVLPLITYVYPYLDGIYSSYTWFDKDEYAIDTFMHAKATWFSIVTLIMIFNVIGIFFKYTSAEKKAFLKRIWPMLVYIICIVLSTVFSLDREFSLHGAFDQMEPFMVLLGYSVTSLYIMMIMRNKDEIKIIVYAGLFSAFVVYLIGILQMFGYDIFVQKWMRFFILNSKLRNTLPDMEAKSSVYSTLGNSNYVGSFVCIMLPLLFNAIIGQYKKPVKIIAFVDIIGLIVLLIGSRSKTGMLVLAFMVVFGAAFLLKSFIKKWYIFVSIGLALVAMFIIIDHNRNGYYSSSIKDLLLSEKEVYDLKGFDTKDDCIKIIYKESEIKFTIDFSNEKIRVKAYEDGDQIPIYHSEVDYSNIIDLKNGEQLNFQVLYIEEKEIRLEIKLPGKVFAFKYDPETGDYTIRNPFGVYDEAVMLDNVFNGRENMASGRGYIWGITIPMLKDYIFIGAGPDTFPVAIGKNGTDYALKYNMNGWASIYLRPHNYYLQMGIDTGCLSLISCLIYFIMYLTECFKLLFMKKLDSEEKKVAYCSMLSVIGFLGCGIANDSLIVVTPLFWTILGIGMTYNKWIMEDNNNVRSIKV